MKAAIDERQKAVDEKIARTSDCCRVACARGNVDPIEYRRKRRVERDKNLVALQIFRSHVHNLPLAKRTKTGDTKCRISLSVSTRPLPYTHKSSQTHKSIGAASASASLTRQRCSMSDFDVSNISSSSKLICFTLKNLKIVRINATKIKK